LGGVYHSIYDDPAWFERFGDPGLVYGAALTQLTTTMLLRLADARCCLSSSAGRQHRTPVRRRNQETGGTKVNFQPILDQLEKTDANAKAYEAAISGSSGPAHVSQPAKVNEALINTERSLTLAKGLPVRDWYRHQIYAPGLYAATARRRFPGSPKRWKSALG
jgi:N-acetylated-alpha-linked acidic dipeptidase